MRDELQLGSYRLTEWLAQGGMGEVFVAKHVLMGREAVVKLLHQKLLNDEDVVKRFLNEARAAAAIRHPGIVEIFDLGRQDGQVFIVMERLHGETLSDRIARAPLILELVMTLTKQLVGALGAAHDQDIIHRDMKPENLFVIDDPDVPGGKRIKILDFGVAKLAPSYGGGTGMTAHGTVFGTPAYMAPEQCKDSATVDHRSDLYAVGCIMYEMLCSEPPFGLGGMELFAAHLRDDPPPLDERGADVPTDLERIVRRLLEKDPGDRFQSCEELLAALDAADLTSRKRAQGKKRRRAMAYAPTMPPSFEGEEGEQEASDGDGDSEDARREKLGRAKTDSPTTPGRSTPVSPTTHRHATGQVVEIAEQEKAKAADAPKKRRTGLWVAAAALLLIAGGGVAYKMAGDQADDDAARAAHQELPPTPPPAPPPPPEPDPDPGAEFLAAAEKALAASQWEDAIVAAKQAIDAEDVGSPIHTRATELQEQAKQGLKYSFAFDNFNTAVEKGDIRSAVYIYEHLPKDSVYRQRATATYETMRAKWLAPHQAKAESAARRKRCRKIDEVQKTVGYMFPESVKPFAKLARRCRAKRDEPEPVEPEPVVDPIDEATLPKVIPKFLIRKELKRHNKRFRACLIENPLPADQAGDGTVKASITIATNGELGDFSIDRGTDGLKSCLWLELRQLKFERAREATQMTFSIGKSRGKRAKKTKSGSK